MRGKDGSDGEAMNRDRRSGGGWRMAGEVMDRQLVSQTRIRDVSGVDQWVIVSGRGQKWGTEGETKTRVDQRGED